MSRIDSEQRTIRSGLSTFLSSNNWGGLTFTEGWEELDITNPLVNVYVFDEGRENLELGQQASQHKLFKRVCQIDVYMESEARVHTICEDVMDYLDGVASTIVDTFTTSGVGYLSFPDSSSITTVFVPPALNHPELLRWRGVVRGSYEAYYPAGGNPI